MIISYRLKQKKTKNYSIIIYHHIEHTNTHNKEKKNKREKSPNHQLRNQKKKM